MARSHVKAAVQGAGRSANSGLSKNRTTSSGDPATNLTGWALDRYRVFTRAHDYVLDLLTRATEAKKAINDARENAEKARAAKDEAIEAFDEEGSMANNAIAENAAAKFRKANEEVTVAERRHAELTRTIKNANGWLAAQGSEVRKKTDHPDPKNPEVIIKGESHQERKERTKKNLVALASLTTTKFQTESPLGLPSISVLAKATGRDEKELRAELCDRDGKPLYEDMPAELKEYFDGIAEDSAQKAELRSFLKAQGFGNKQQVQEQVQAS